MAARHYWTKEEIDVLMDAYSSISTETIAKALGVSALAVYAKANALNLYKSETYLTQTRRALGKRLSSSGNAVATRFSAGMTPWNKGKKGLYTTTAATKFKPGHTPRNWKPIGSERITKDGYLQRKITDTGNPPRDWKGVHCIIWEAENGPVPPGHHIAFRDGNKRNLALENLELVSRQEMMRRNTKHNLPPELLEVVNLKSAIVRRINRRKKQEQQHHDE